MKRLLCSVFLVMGLAALAAADQVPDSGGTAAMPIRLDYVSVGPMQIVDGLPAGSPIKIGAVLEAPVVTAEVPGGTWVGGTKSGGGGGPLFTWQMQGTGVYAGYSRTLSFPPLPSGSGVLSFAHPNFDPPAPAGASIEVHSAPRTPGQPVQSFDTDMFRMFSQIAIIGDPDFDLLRVVGGTDFGLPSPGHTTLTRLPSGNWNVDSFFDITYRIDFVGAPGGAFAGRSGSTTGTIRLQTGHSVPEPTTLVGLGTLALVTAPLLLWRRRAARGRPDPVT